MPRTERDELDGDTEHTCDWCCKAFLGRRSGCLICRLCWTRFVRDGALYRPSDDSYAVP